MGSSWFLRGVLKLLRDVILFEESYVLQSDNGKEIPSNSRQRWKCVQNAGSQRWPDSRLWMNSLSGTQTFRVSLNKFIEVRNMLQLSVFAPRQTIVPLAFARLNAIKISLARWLLHDNYALFSSFREIVHYYFNVALMCSLSSLKLDDWSSVGINTMRSNVLCGLVNI